MREISISSYCNTSAAKFWSLRQDRGYDEWFAGLDGQVPHACAALRPNLQTLTLWPPLAR